MTKKLYKISQEDNNDYDTYDSAIVCSESEDYERNIHPDGTINFDIGEYSTWTHKENVKVEYIGIADDSIPIGVVLASFNAG